ncbi:hypothetical protein GTA08_BOTSDO00433 [Botryosphaeria dothidea]|uniref:Uncharacterized protein n=1 Tax=Botryosphaeria dothidea TaxID=55169 RepID=A0A8H4NFF0_9PEZI|nr:hypothetical protein GTA08_BOTSDO00433 [Botryosphaeria dothidea]
MFHSYLSLVTIATIKHSPPGTRPRSSPPTPPPSLLPLSIADTSRGPTRLPQLPPSHALQRAHRLDARAAVIALAVTALAPIHPSRFHSPALHRGGMSGLPANYTPLESLLLFQSLVCYGVDPPVFARVSDLLTNNDAVKSAPTFSPDRLTPDALRDLYLCLLKEEVRDELQSQTENEPPVQNGDSPSRKRKLPSPSLPSVQEAAQHQHLLPKLIQKLYARYRRHAIDEIREHEKRYEHYSRELRAIQNGDWDERLQSEHLVNGTKEAPQPSPPAEASPAAAPQPPAEVAPQEAQGPVLQLMEVLLPTRSPLRNPQFSLKRKHNLHLISGPHRIRNKLNNLPRDLHTSNLRKGLTLLHMVPHTLPRPWAAQMPTMYKSHRVRRRVNL